MAKDMMPAFQLFQPDDLESAFSLLDKFGDRAWILAGGQDSFDWFKDRGKLPEAVIDICNIATLKGVRETADGIEVGALTTLNNVINNDIIAHSYSLLVDAASRVASPQIRNVGTLGGNVNQDTRCWYYRRGLDCYRAGGNICYADSPEGMNREHALFDASRCVAVSPSDTATALVALEATMIARSVNGTRNITAEDFFVGPATHITSMTSLESDEILTAIRLPAKWAGARFYFEKVADRDVWDFALVSIAVAMSMDGDTVSDSRFICGGVACTPYRLRDVERAARGKTLSDESGEAIAALASQGAKPLNYNHFKVPLMENLVRRAMRG